MIFKELDNTFKKTDPHRIGDRFVKISLSSVKTSFQKPVFSNAFGKFSKTNEIKSSVFAKPSLPAESQNPCSVDQYPPLDDDEIDPLDAYMFEINPQAV